MSFTIQLTTYRNLSRVGYASIVYDRKYISTKYLMPHGLKVKPYLSYLTVAYSNYKYNNECTSITHGILRICNITQLMNTNITCCEMC